MRNVWLGVCVGSVMLGACGGGGSSHVTPPPPPPPPPSFPLTASASFPSLYSERQYTQGVGGGLSSLNGVSPRPGPTIAYDAASGSYTISGPTVVSFTTADRTSTSGYLDVYQKQGTGFSDALQLYNNVRAGASQAGAPIQLTYLSYGIWSHVDTQTDEKRRHYLLFGYPTTSVPTSGAANYSTSITASMVEGGPAFAAAESDVGGTATFSVNFGTGSISTDLNLQRVGGGSIGTFNGTGTMTADQFAGTFTSGLQSFQAGQFAGGFFGPHAEEMGYGFYINLHIADPFAGATVAPMDTLITGAVLGKKQ